MAVASDKLTHTNNNGQLECNCDPESQIHVYKDSQRNDKASPTLLLHIVKQPHHHSSTPTDVVASIFLCLGDGSYRYPLGELLVLCQFDDISGKSHTIADYFLTDTLELGKPLWYQEKVDEHALQLITNLNLKETIDIALKRADISDLDHLIQSAIATDGHVNLLPRDFQVSKRPTKTTYDFIKLPKGHMSLLHHTEYDGSIETTYFLCIDSRNQLYLIVIVYKCSTKYQLQMSDGFSFNQDLAVCSFKIKFMNEDSRQHKLSIHYAIRVANDVIPKILKHKGWGNIQHLSSFGKSLR